MMKHPKPYPKRAYIPRLSAALHYANAGWAVLPVHTITQSGCSCGAPACSAPGKHPRTAHGVHNASLNESQIRIWWGERWPEANVGIRTGAPLLVLDVDPQHDGERALRTLTARFGPLPATWCVCTGGGGRHYYFRTQDELGNRVRIARLPGLDLRGRGGYVIAPPSLHVSGRPYLWAQKTSPLAVVPAWLSDLVRDQAVPGTSQQRWVCATPATPNMFLEQALSSARVGNRNQTGFILACRLRNLGVPLETARDLLLEYAARVPQLGHPYFTSEALASLTQAYRRAHAARRIRRDVRL